MTLTDTFVLKANNKHGNKYDYSSVCYENAKTKVDIKCHIHGLFSITPNNHLRGVGCKKCSALIRGDKLRKSQSTFVTEATKIHDGKYSYDKVVYVNAKTSVVITCEHHGDFMKSPNMHLRGQGCPRCADRFKMQNAWLTYRGLPDDQAHRQVCFKLPCGSRIVADGFDSTSNTIYEFWGDKWHGNLSRFAPNDINPKTKLTYQQHWDLTKAKVDKIRNAGYNLVQIWESQWKSLERTKNHKIQDLLSELYDS